MFELLRKGVQNAGLSRSVRFHTHAVRKFAVQKEFSQQTAGENVIWNPCNIQMIPDSLHSQIFTDSFRCNEFDPRIVDKCRKHLEKHSLWGQTVQPLPNVDGFVIPTLEGEDINDHFRNIARQQTFKYKKLLDALRDSVIPAKPKKWEFKVSVLFNHFAVQPRVF